MKRYQDYGYDENKINEFDTSKVDWTKYAIVVPTEDDRKEVLEALEHMHDADIDTDFVTVNQLCHEYQTLYRDEYPSYENDPKNYNVLVNEKLYKEIKDKIKEYYK